MGPYAYKDKQWVGYDDVATLRRKSEYIRSMGLGGGMVWALDLDDFSNRCGQGRHPLMHAIKAVLGPAREAEEVTQEQEIVVERDKEADQADNTDNDEDNTVVDGGDGDETNDVPVDEPDDEVADAGHKVVCYFTNWAWYRPQGGKFQPRDIQAELCTHIVYGFAVLDPDTLTIKAHDTWADFDNGQINISTAENVNK